MSAMNPPCVAELNFMRILPLKLQGMTEAALKLSESMDRLSAALEKHNEQDLVVQTAKAPVSAEPLDRAVETGLKPMPTAHDIRQTQLEAANG